METPEEKRHRHEWMAACIKQLGEYGISDTEMVSAGPEFLDYFYHGVHPDIAVQVYLKKRTNPLSIRLTHYEINNEQYIKSKYPPGPQDHWANGSGRCKFHGRKFMCDDCARDGRYFFMPHEHGHTGPYGRWANVRDTDFIKKFFTRWMALQRDELSDAEKFN